MDNLKQLLGLPTQSLGKLLGVPEPIEKLGRMFGTTPAVAEKKSAWDFFPGEVVSNIKKARSFISDITTPKNEQGQPLNREEALRQGIVKAGNFYIDPTGAIGSLEDVSGKTAKNLSRKLINVKQGGTYLTPAEHEAARYRADGRYLDKHGNIVEPKNASPSMGEIASTGDYLYHGTNEEVIDSIAKNGLKPMRRGLLSLSRDEAYAKSFARSGITPRGKTNAVMLRVKSDLLKGKTVPGSSSRPMSDQLHEILTKEAIPPEYLEVYKNGKWQPLKSNPLKTTTK